MTTLVIDNKSYVVIPAKSYEALQKKAALKTRPEKTLSIEEARAHSKKLIKKWATGK
jgi:PHD/YefM family antitoxin component YafN of YafNO toxin-antitoxin module